MTTFQKATKTQVKLRMALDGPSGSGKTYTALVAAKALANGGKVAVIDTERGSASLYADLFDFDVCELTNFNPANYVSAIEAAEEAGYSVIVIDSLSHAWEGEGGVLDLHEDAIKRQRVENSYTAWKDVTPLHRRLVDSMLQSKCHIVATMRSKTEYAIEVVDGKNKVKKIGMAPIQRQGMEYEFTIVGDLDLDHNLVITKSRMATLADKVENKPGEKFFRQVADWLNSGAAPEPKAEPAKAQLTPEPKKENEPSKVVPTRLDTLAKILVETKIVENDFHAKGALKVLDYTTVNDEDAIRRVRIYRAWRDHDPKMSKEDCKAKALKGEEPK